MAKAYSYDLRKKVMEFIKSGGKIIRASEIFNISRKVIFDWKKLERETGGLEAKTGYQKGHSHSIRDIAGFEKFLKDNADKSGKELASLWPGKISGSTILRLIRKLGYSYKKNFLSSEKRLWVKKGIYGDGKSYS